MDVLSCGPKASNISGISEATSPRFICKNPRSMYARVLQAIALLICSKNIKIVPYHWDSPNNRIEMARAYDLHPR